MARFYEWDLSKYHRPSGSEIHILCHVSVLSLAKILREKHALWGKTAEDGREPVRILTDSNYMACYYQGDSVGCNDEFLDDGDHTRSRMI